MVSMVACYLGGPGFKSPQGREFNKYDNHLNSVQVNTLYYYGCVAWACNCLKCPIRVIENITRSFRMLIINSLDKYISRYYFTNDNCILQAIPKM